MQAGEEDRAPVQLKARKREPLFTLKRGFFHFAIEKGGYVIGWSADRHDLSPEVVLTSMVQSVPKLVLAQGELLKAGNWKPEATVWGIKGGIQTVGVWSSVVPADIKNEITQDWEDLRTGKLKKRVN